MVKVFNFYGADHKAGVTMTVQSIADALSEKYPQQRVLVLHLDGREGMDYSAVSSEGMDAISEALRNSIAEYHEIMDLIKPAKNIYQLAGTKRNNNAVTLYPEHAKTLIDICKDYFDIVLIDSGSSIDSNGLSLGAFEYDCPNIMITTQQESAFTTFINRFSDIYASLDHHMDFLVINKFSFGTGSFLKTQREIENVYGAEESFTIVKTNADWQAEAEKTSLYNLKIKAYRNDILKLIDAVILS